MITNCPTAENGDLVHRYVAGTLKPEELERFEIHLLECTACQRAVRQGAALRMELLTTGRTRRRRLYIWSVIPLAAAAALAVVLLWPKESALQRLGSLEAVPAFEGLPVRAEPDDLTTLVDRGMAAYVRGDYREAAKMLSSASQAEPNPGVSFYLGIAEMKAGSAERAVAAFRAALDPPTNPYTADARFYLAKTWLRLGEADSALAHLTAVPPTPARLHDHAIALADSVREVIR